MGEGTCRRQTQEPRERPAEWCFSQGCHCPCLVEERCESFIAARVHGNRKGNTRTRQCWRHHIDGGREVGRGDVCGEIRLHNGLWSGISLTTKQTSHCDLHLKLHKTVCILQRVCALEKAMNSRAWIIESYSSPSHYTCMMHLMALFCQRRVMLAKVWLGRKQDKANSISIKKHF